MRIQSLFLLSLSLILIHCVQTNEGADEFTVGQNAHQLLASDSYSSLLVEIQPVSGYAPQTASINALQTFLTSRLNKPGGITIVVDTPIASPGKSSYSVADVAAIESANRLHYASGSQLVAYYLFLDAHSSADSANGDILGEAYSSTSIGMFEGTIQSNSGSLGQVSRQILETTVMEHEFGHLLGLVNLGSGMQTAHQDTANGAHCTDTACLMYWQVETTASLANLITGGAVPSLDADCLADLRANGGK